MESFIIEARRRLHEYPEVGFELDKTLEFLRSELDKMGVEYTEKYGKSSIVATINPEKTNFTIGIRADIDALPVTEETDLPFKSKNCVQGLIFINSLVLPVAFSIVMVAVCIERINEIKKGEEDDISKY